MAKIAGIKLAQAYRQQYGFPAISLMPTNLYGPGDNFDLNSRLTSCPRLCASFTKRRRGDTPEVVLWGTGAARREFLHVDDLADAAVFLMQEYDSGQIINVGSGEDLTILELARIIQEITGYRGALRFDDSKPDGTPRKLLDVSALSALGWKPKIPLHEGIEKTYRWYLEHLAMAAS